MALSVITVEHLSKRFRIGAAQQRVATFGEALRRAMASPFDYLRMRLRKATEEETLWALKDVSFEVKQGEVLGIIGRNGAGKSTLLKILSRITDPTEGRAIIRGRVNSLLEVGIGFHRELTGRENIYMNAAMHGMKRAEIKRKLDEIVAFAEVEKFLDTPVKYYSSGMYTRLAFAVAAHLDPDILLVDEVLAVGDMAFQQKCLGKMEDVAREGRTVLFVSHQMAAVEGLTQRSILLQGGRIVFAGPTPEVIREYLRTTQGMARAVSIAERSDRVGTGEYRVLRVWLTDASGMAVTGFRSGETSVIHALLVPAGDVCRLMAVASICFRDATGYRLFTAASSLKCQEFDLHGPTEVCWYFPRMPLTQGNYRCDIFVSRAAGDHPVDYILDAFCLPVYAGNFFGTGREQGIGLDKVYVDFDLTAKPFNGAISE